MAHLEAGRSAKEGGACEKTVASKSSSKKECQKNRGQTTPVVSLLPDRRMTG